MGPPAPEHTHKENNTFTSRQFTLGLIMNFYLPIVTQTIAINDLIVFLSLNIMNEITILCVFVFGF